jgi:hypothetical protein
MDDGNQFLPGELSHGFAKSHAGNAPTHSPGDLCREFRFVAWAPEHDFVAPALTYDLDPGRGPSMSIKEQHASRREEVGKSLSSEFKRVSKRNPNAPDLGR